MNIPAVPMPSVVEISVAREILYRAGFCVRREGDFIIVFDNGEENLFYAREHIGEREFGQLYCDEGYYSNCLQYNAKGELNAEMHSKPWQEVVDWRTLLQLLVNKFAPDAKIKEPITTGRASREIHYISEFVNLLIAVELKSGRGEIKFT